MLRSDHPPLRRLEQLCRHATGSNMAHYTDDLRADTIGTIERYFIAPLKNRTLSAERKAALDAFMDIYGNRRGQGIDAFSDEQVEEMIGELKALK